MATLTKQLDNREVESKRGRFVQSLSNALIITRREVRDSFRDWRIMVPIVILTLIFPLMANGMTRAFISFFENNGAKPLLPSLLPLMPMIVGFFPISISLVIALETFVGEKERLSLEPLLSTPLTNIELYMGKSFAAMLPPLMASYIGLVIYVGGLVLGSQQWRPPALLVLQIVLLTTVQALVMVTGAVVVSSQTTSTRAANLLASFIIIPMSMLVILDSIIMVQPHRRYLLWFIILGLMVTIMLLIRMGARIFNREELLGRSLDHLNFRWAWRTIWEQFRGPGLEGRMTLRRWYQKSVFPAVASLRTASAVTVVCITAAFIAGWVFAAANPISLDQFNPTDEKLLDNLQTWFQLGQDNPRLIVMAIMQNSRILIGATLLAIFTFGVMAMVLVMIPFGLMGFILGQVVLSGINPAPFLMAVLPHGIIEVPAIVLAGAAALRLGSVITRPPLSMTVGEAWLRALGDTIKIGVGLVAPMLIVAGILEVTLTPRIVELVLKL